MRLWSFCTLLVGLVACSTGNLSAQDSRPNNVEQVLQEEASGQAVDRRSKLSVNQSDESAWQAGFLSQGGRLIPLEDLGKQQSEKDKLYEQKRRELFGQPNWHTKLARWCVRMGLDQRARAHYFAVVARLPNHEEARKFLGHQRFGNRWFDAKEIAWAKGRAAEVMLAFDKWSGKVKSIISLLEKKDARSTKKALDRLEQLNAPELIHVLEFFATNIDDDLAKPLIAKIADFRSREACLAMVRIALVTTQPELRTLLARKIKTYPPEMYLPELLPLLQSDTVVHSQFSEKPNGELSLVTLVASELHGEKHVRKFEKQLSVAASFSSTVSVGLAANDRPVPAFTSGARVRVDDVPRALGNAARQSLAEENRQNQISVQRQNWAQSQETTRVCSLLRALTGESIPDEPERWWSWWTEKYERTEGVKPTYRYASSQKRNMLVSTHRYSAALDSAHSYFFCRCTCLVAGTEIQTSSGLKAVEKIQVGDLVAAQNIETGKLSLRPVVMTTVRAPRPTVLIKTEKDLIEATGGHMWWVAGEGWRMARELKAGMQLHTASGTTEVKAVEEHGEPQKTYNLVVDADHSYFVGKERVLSYDNTTVKGTLRTVPGFGTANAKK